MMVNMSCALEDSQPPKGAMQPKVEVVMVIALLLFVIVLVTFALVSLKRTPLVTSATASPNVPTIQHLTHPVANNIGIRAPRSYRSNPVELEHNRIEPPARAHTVARHSASDIFREPSPSSCSESTAIEPGETDAVMSSSHVLHDLCAKAGDDGTNLHL